MVILPKTRLNKDKFIQKRTLWSHPSVVTCAPPTDLGQLRALASESHLPAPLLGRGSDPPWGAGREPGGAVGVSPCHARWGCGHMLATKESCGALGSEI